MLIELTFLKKLILIKQVHQRSVIFPTMDVLYKGFKFQLYVCNECHDLLMMYVTLDDMAILNICGVDYRCNIYGISKSDAVRLLQNVDFTKKKGILQNQKIYYHI